MITGGNDESSVYLDSTEIFSDNVWRTVAAKLPSTLSATRVATINNRVLAFGNSLLFVIDWILKYDVFLQVGPMVEVIERKF